MVLENPELKK